MKKTVTLTTRHSRFLTEQETINLESLLHEMDLSGVGDLCVVELTREHDDEDDTEKWYIEVIWEELT